MDANDGGRISEGLTTKAQGHGEGGDPEARF